MEEHNLIYMPILSGVAGGRTEPQVIDVVPECFSRKELSLMVGGPLECMHNDKTAFWYNDEGMAVRDGRVKPMDEFTPLTDRERVGDKIGQVIGAAYVTGMTEEGEPRGLTDEEIEEVWPYVMKVFNSNRGKFGIGQSLVWLESPYQSGDKAMEVIVEGAVPDFSNLRKGEK